jgi:pyridoxine 4-dehydrogenase
MPESSAKAAGTLTIGFDLVVNRLGYGTMRLTGTGMCLTHLEENPGAASIDLTAERLRAITHLRSE